MTVELVVAHTADLDRALLDSARALLWDVFDDIEDSDWEHCLGGVHALLLEDGDVIGHASVVQRRLLHGGKALRCGYVEGVAVRADRRRRGHAGQMMEALERVIRSAYHVGALGSSDEALIFYSARGWLLWRGPTSALTPDGIVRTPDDDGGVFVLPVSARLNVDAELTCDWREGDVW